MTQEVKQEEKENEIIKACKEAYAQTNDAPNRFEAAEPLLVAKFKTFTTKGKAKIIRRGIMLYFSDVCKTHRDYIKENATKKPWVPSKAIKESKQAKKVNWAWATAAGKHYLEVLQIDGKSLSNHNRLDFKHLIDVGNSNINTNTVNVKWYKFLSTKCTDDKTIAQHQKLNTAFATECQKEWKKISGGK